MLVQIYADSDILHYILGDGG